MGFAEVRAKKSLMFGAGSDLESAVNWLMEHQDDEGIDDPIPEEEVMAAGVPEAMEVDDEGDWFSYCNVVYLVTCALLTGIDM